MREESPSAVEAQIPTVAAFLAAVLFLPAFVTAGQAPGAQPEDPEIEQLVVEAERLPEGAADPFGVLDAAPGDTVFGLDKTAWETPRSTASLSEELLGRHGVETVEDFSQIIPGAHTASFFGLAASIDLRGALADTHFRGMRRLVSAGGWQSLIRATDRVDIVRGPASPIHGAGSISGYINLVPKTARADEDRFIEAPRGDVAVRVASWDRHAFEGQRGGPARLFGKPAGYHVFGLWEDSGSYYREHPGQRQLMLQGTLVVDLRGDVWIEVGQQYQRWRGAENAGWNRVDQKLIDEGLYLSGEPLVNLDSDRDGRISQREVLAVSPRNRLSVFQPYGQSGLTFDSEAERQALRLDPDTLRHVPIGAEHCLCAPSDSGAAESLAAYFDVFAELGGVTLRQKLFVDYADRHIVASYGFSQQHRTVLVEERLEAVFRGLELGRTLTADLVVAPNLRYYDTRARQDFSYEYFNRRDISKPPSPLDLRDSAFASPGREARTTDIATEWLNLGVAALADVTFLERWSVLAGARWDRYDLTSTNGPGPLVTATPNASASTVQSKLSWSVSISVALGNWRPYLTVAEQALSLGGQSGEISVRNVSAGPLGTSRLREAGLKFAGLGGRLQAALAWYEQKRVDYSAFADANLAVLGRGLELDVRAAVSERLGLLFSATRSRIYREPLTGRFIFAPTAITGLAPEDHYGGHVVTVLPAGDTRFRERGALPEFAISAGGTWQAARDLALTLSVSRVGPAWSGVARTVRLPAYTLANASVSWTIRRWTAILGVNNALDELYFQGNFPQIFGDVVVLARPERNWRLTLRRSFGS